MLELALVVNDLLQPEPRLNAVFRQTVLAAGECFAKCIRADVRAEMRRVGDIYEPECVVLGPTGAKQETFTI